MTSDATDWHQALARVTGALVRGEQRVTTHELLTEHLGIPVTDRACRRLRRVMRELGWRGPQKMRWGERTIQGYWRHPTVGVPAMECRQERAEEQTSACTVHCAQTIYTWRKLFRGFQANEVRRLMASKMMRFNCNRTAYRGS